VSVYSLDVMQNFR